VPEPPVAVAVNVTFVPLGCGETRLAVIPVRSNAFDGAPGAIANGTLTFAPLSYVSAVLPAFRTHTAIREAALALVGVHVYVLLVVQFWRTVQVEPSDTHHLN
jgi:hypothetical protein